MEIKGETPKKKGRENDENAVMAARAEGQTRMLWKRTKHSKRDGQQEKRGEGTERRRRRRRTVVLGLDDLTPTAVTAAPAEVLISSPSLTSR